jgi:hypothetical protein
VRNYKPPDPVEHLLKLKAEEKRVFITVREAATISGQSEVRVRKLIASEELPSILDGRSRRVLAVGVYDRLIAMAKASNPTTGPKPKAGKFWGVRPQERGVAR